MIQRDLVGQKNEVQKHFWCKHILGPKKYKGQTNFGSKQFLNKKRFWFGCTKILGKKIWYTNELAPKISWSKKLWV